VASHVLGASPPPFSPSVISFMPILNFAQWEAVDTEWLSPLAITLRNNNKWPDNLETMGYARQVADPQPFLTLAAKNAYWQAPMICLLALAKKECEITLTGNDAEKLLTLIQAALQCSESQALVYLEMRMTGLTQEEDERHLELLTSDEADDNFTDADQKLANRAVTAMQCKMAQAKLVEDLISKKCRPHKAGPKAGTKAGTKTKFQGSKTKVPDMQHCTVKKLTECLPPGSSCKMDTFNGRWHVFYRRNGAIKGPWRSCSRSWGSRTHKQCVMQLLLGIGCQPWCALSPQRPHEGASG
jgi:SHS2 domain-containing protein